MIGQSENKAIKTRADYIKAALANKRTTPECQRLHRLYAMAACPTCGTEIPQGAYDPGEFEAYFGKQDRRVPAPDPRPAEQVAAIAKADEDYRAASEKRDRLGRELLGLGRGEQDRYSMDGRTIPGKKATAAEINEASVAVDQAEQEMKEAQQRSREAAASWPPVRQAGAKRSSWRTWI